MKATLKVKITLQVGGGVAFKATRVVDNLVLHLKTVTNGKKTFVFSYATPNTLAYHRSKCRSRTD